MEKGEEEITSETGEEKYTGVGGNGEDSRGALRKEFSKTDVHRLCHSVADILNITNPNSENNSS